MAYLDANATEPLRPEARAAVIAALDVVGNPSSVHAAGRAARRMLEDCRAAVARRFGASAEGVVFTSGGTEADALAVAGLRAGRRLIVGATEHDAVRAAAANAELLPVNSDGVADLAALERLLAGGEPALVCLMLANNETGTIQPVAAAAALCRRAGALLHVDAVQAAGRIPVDLAALGADSLALSSHKLGGPKGAGALLLAEGRELGPLIAGGGQERGRRGGTPALPAIAGLAAAAAAAVPPALASLRDAVEDAACRAGGLVLGGPHRLPNTSCLALPGVRAETQVIALDLLGVQVSAGAACSSGKVQRSHVLDAMGLGTLAGESIRVSLPWNAGWADVESFAAAYGAMASRLGRRAAEPAGHVSSRNRLEDALVIDSDIEEPARMPTRQLLLHLPEDLLLRFKRQVPSRGRSAFIQRLLEQALPGADGDNDPLYQLAVEVERDEALTTAMAEWDVTLGDGLDPVTPATRA